MAYLLQQLLADSAKRDPGKDAVVYRDRKIGYRELDELSNRLANVLVAHGVGRGDRVGICLPKSIESVVAVFGILKAGAVYVPLDPSAPARRQAFIAANCEMKALVGARKKIAAIGQHLTKSCSLECVISTDSEAPAGPGARSTAAMLPWGHVQVAPADPPEAPPVIEDDLAYILYTSGSTGEPKGVMISHRASLTFVNWAFDCFQVQPADRVSNHAPLHFDLSIFDIFVTIQAGATVVLAPEELSIFPMDLARFIEEQRISIWYSVPSVLTRLVLHGNLARYSYPHLRTILFAGEVFPVKYLRGLRGLIPHAGYYNLFGPTETNVCTWYQVDELPPDETTLPIGRVCANTEAFVMNDRRELAAPGETGELWVRGPGLMKGYWGLPERTSQVLLRHALHPLLGEELVYRTGDMVKLGAGGNYVFFGRRDHMIKSRGYRIELGEIETALYSHPKVLEAAVIAVPDEQIGHAIKAVVVPQEAAALTAHELEYFCSQRIPKYMIPGSIEFRSSLPKTSTGKIDKTLLAKQQLETVSG